MSDPEAAEGSKLMSKDEADQSVQIEGVLTEAAGYWPVLMIRGLVLLALGAAFIWFPDETVNAVSILFGVMLLFEAANSGLQICVLQNNTADNPLRGAVQIYNFFYDAHQSWIGHY